MAPPVLAAGPARAFPVPLPLMLHHTLLPLSTLPSPLSTPSPLLACSILITSHLAGPTMKLKIRGPGDSVPSTPISENPPVHTPAATTPSSATAPGAVRIKLKSSQPPTPMSESAPLSLPLPLQGKALPLGPPVTKPKRPYNKKPKLDAATPSALASSNKRPAADDISPVSKKPALSLAASRRNSIRHDHDTALDVSTPLSAAGPRITFKKPAALQQPQRRESGPKRILLANRKAGPPPRPVGVGYDSEASDAEDDPLVESQMILRMQPGPDCDYLREAIQTKTFPEGTDIKVKFLDKALRRLILTIRGNNYAAVMVDLPCIIEGMKSWDKRGWWKVADICQMMLVLGPTESEETAKSYPLPKEVDKHTWAYAHGLTPPMHYVRKRRFRKRPSYKAVEHIDDEVERLLKADADAISSTYKVIDENDLAATDLAEGADQDVPMEDAYYEEDPTDYVSTTENGYGQASFQPEEQDADADAEEDFDLEQGLFQALGDADDADAHVVDITQPLPVADKPASLGDVESAIREAAAAVVPFPPTTTTLPPNTSITSADAQGDYSSDEDDDDDDYASDEDVDEPLAIDEDLVARERELEGQRQDIEELERRIAQTKTDILGQKNMLLRQRKQKTLRDLEEELAVKRRALGMDGDGDDYDDEDVLVEGA